MRFVFGSFTVEHDAVEVEDDGGKRISFDRPILVICGMLAHLRHSIVIDPTNDQIITVIPP